MQRGAGRRIEDPELAVIARTDLFSGLTIGDVRRLTGHALLRRHERHSLLFSQGDPADRFFIVLSGRVKLFTVTEDGDQNVVEIFGPGESFAEAALFASARFPVGAETVEPSQLIHIGAEPFLRALAADPQVAFRIVGALARRHHQLLRELAEIKMRSPGQRLGAFLLGLTPAEAGAATLRLPFDKALVAARIGIKPESLSRALARLRDVGVVCQGRDVAIEDLGRLRDFCEEGDGP